ncbi:MAG TPA: arylsulfotransferase family protein [Longimicrobiales bacterium]|nr:arylsulfotransferase family protein [Longimicrobiales bacterium]
MRPGYLPAAALLSAAGCASDGIGPAIAPVPVIEQSAVAANPHNVLSAVVVVRAQDADSVAVRFGIAGQPLTSATPAVRPAAESFRVPVLGLLSATPYRLQAVAYGGGHAGAGDTLALTTGTLPDDLPAYVTEGTDPAPGYVVFAALQYGLVIDNTGRVVWYRHFPDGLGINFQAQPDGRYAALPPPPQTGQPAAWVELDALGDVVRTLTCAHGLAPRFHDLLAQPDGSYWILCDDTRTIDLSAAGGAAAARVTGTVVQHFDATGALQFEWSVFDHFAITDLPPAELAVPSINWTHGNALDLDTDGNLLVSFRNLSEITKIDTGTGVVIWRMGGVRNQFTFEDITPPAFARQHGVRSTSPGTLILLDNLGDPGDSRAKRYSYDAAAYTARLMSAYGSQPPITAQLGGTTQPIPGGRVLVSFGSGARVAEYDAAGNERWRIMDPGYVFRAQRIESLYAPGVGSAR